ncbi:hypothetical protein GCM10027091_63780 [Streptomyces daliensis]
MDRETYRMELSDRSDLPGTSRPTSRVPRRLLLGALGAAALLGTAARPAAAAASAAAYPLLSRAQWGADEALRHDADGTEIWPPRVLSRPDLDGSPHRGRR